MSQPNYSNEEIVNAILAMTNTLMQIGIPYFYIGFGLNETAIGSVTNTSDMYLRVYITEDLSEQKRNLIPPGYTITRPDNSTSVIPICKIEMFSADDDESAWVPTPEECQDLSSSIDELKSGFTIGNYKGMKDPRRAAIGTLGFFAQRRGATESNYIVAVTNGHVLSAKYVDNVEVKAAIKKAEESGLSGIALRQAQENAIAKELNKAIGDSVYRVHARYTNGDPKLDVAKETSTIIGTIEKSLKKHQQYSYVNGKPHTAGDYYYVDCGTVDITSRSSCKKCENTMPYRNEARIDPKTIDGIAALRPADIQKTGGYKVHKIGRSTGLTTGTVVDAGGLGADTDLNVIVIDAIDDNQNMIKGTLRFLDHGDSGAALLNEQNQIVGIVYATDSRNPRRAYACHIHPVFEALQLDIDDDVFPNAGPPPKANSTLLDTPATVDGGQPDPVRAVRDGFLGSEQGHRFLALYQQHRNELVHLVNNSRRVTVVWHRNKGPAYLNRIIHALRDPDMKIPREIDGVSRETLIRNMAQVLDERGSDAMKELVANHLDEALAYARRFDSVREFVDLLVAEKAQ